MRSVLWYVFIGSRGGETRLRIVESLLRKPKNPNELKVELGMDYSTIRHNLRVLEKNSILFTQTQGYAAAYELTPEFKTMLPDYELLKEKYLKKVGKAT